MTFPLPNVLTGLRVVMVPVFVWAYLGGQYGFALGTFITAAVTDVLDGVLARALKQFTKLGAFLDPLADKALGLAAIAVLTWAHRLPVWLIGLVIFRDACIFSAIGILSWTGRTFPLRPTRFGKYSTFCLLLTVVVALEQQVFAPNAGEQQALVALVLLSGLCVVVAWAQYLTWFIQLMRLPPGAVQDLPRTG